MYAKDGYSCVFCSSRGPLSLDHVVQVKDCIGKFQVMVINHEANLVTSCLRCNGGRVNGVIRLLRYGRFKGNEVLFMTYQKRTAIALEALQESLPIQQAAERAAWVESQKLVNDELPRL